MDDEEYGYRAPWDHAHKPQPCRWDDIGTSTIADTASPEERAKAEAFLAEVNEYLAGFVKPVILGEGENRYQVCFHCGWTVSKGFHSLLGMPRHAAFEWGLVHGEGHCSNCHYPARAYHRPKGKDGEELFSLTGMFLQYMPDAEKEAEARREAEHAG